MMKNILKETYLLFFLLPFLLVVSLLPFFYEFIIPAPGKIKLYWHNYPYDFTYYRSVILQGYEGNFLTQDRYTSEPHQPIFIRPFYIFLGHLSRLSRIDPTLIYHLARIFLGAIFLLVIVYFIQAYFTVVPPSEESLSGHLGGGTKPKRLVAYILTFLVAGFPKDKWPYLPFLTELQITRRITFLPHFLLGYIGLTLMILFFCRPTIRGVPFGPPRRRDYPFSLKFFLASVFLGFTGLSHPPSLIFFFPLLIVFLFLLFLSNQPLKTKVSILKLSVISFLLLYPFLSYLFFNLTQTPWNQIYGQRFSLGGSFWEYLLALGPSAFLAIGGVILTLISLLKRQEVSILRIMATSWFLTSNFLVLLPRFKSFYAETRFTQVALFLPAALLGTDFVFFISKFLARYRILELNMTRINLTKKILVKGFVFFLLVITLPPQISIYQAQFDEVKANCQQKLSSLPHPPVADYPPGKLMEAIYWLRDQTHKKDIVLSQFYAGNLIPAYSGNFVYLGHNSETINFGEKFQNVNRFFPASPNEQINFLKENNIGYIFYGPQEKSLGDLVIEKLPIVPIFQNELVTIYHVVAANSSTSEVKSADTSEVFFGGDKIRI